MFVPVVLTITFSIFVTNIISNKPEKNEKNNYYLNRWL